MLRLSWLNVWKNSESSPEWYGGTVRPTSPPLAASSTLITSAPSSARWTLPNGPAPYCSIAITRTSASGRRRLAAFMTQIYRFSDGQIAVSGSRGPRHTITGTSCSYEIAYGVPAVAARSLLAYRCVAAPQSPPTSISTSPLAPCGPHSQYWLWPLTTGGRS